MSSGIKLKPFVPLLWHNYSQKISLPRLHRPLIRIGLTHAYAPVWYVDTQKVISPHTHRGTVYPHPHKETSNVSDTKQCYNMHLPPIFLWCTCSFDMHFNSRHDTSILDFEGVVPLCGYMKYPVCVCTIIIYNYVAWVWFCEGITFWGSLFDVPPHLHEETTWPWFVR